MDASRDARPADSPLRATERLSAPGAWAMPRLALHTKIMTWMLNRAKILVYRYDDPLEELASSPLSRIAPQTIRISATMPGPERRSQFLDFRVRAVCCSAFEFARSCRVPTLVAGIVSRLSAMAETSTMSRS